MLGREGKKGEGKEAEKRGKGKGRKRKVGLGTGDEKGGRVHEEGEDGVDRVMGGV